MNRRDFLKNLGIVAIVPMLPEKFIFDLGANLKTYSIFNSVFRVNPVGCGMAKGAIGGSLMVPHVLGVPLSEVGSNTMIIRNDFYFEEYSPKFDLRQFGNMKIKDAKLFPHPERDCYILKQDNKTWYFPTA